MLRLCGADLREVPAVPYKNPGNYVHVSGAAGRGARRRPSRNGAIWANQFDNVANRQGHYRHHRPGDLGADRRQGRRLHLRRRHRRHARRGRHGAEGAQPEVRIAPRRPDGRRALQLLQERRAQGRRQLDHRGHRPGPHYQESRGRADRHPVSDPDEEALPIIFDLLKHEGLCLGGSSGINVAGAIRLAKELGPGHTIVTILCDYGTRYQTKLFNPAFLRSKNLPVPDWLDQRR